MYIEFILTWEKAHKRLHTHKHLKLKSLVLLNCSTFCLTRKYTVLKSEVMGVMKLCKIPFRKKKFLEHPLKVYYAQFEINFNTKCDKM